MFARLLAAALASGILAGGLITVVQAFTTAPLILLAEAHESSSHAAVAPSKASFRADGSAGVALRLVHDDGSGAGGGSDGGGAWAPEDGIERSFYTLLSNLVGGVAFAALLVAAFGLSRSRVDARSGVVWGLAGFAVFAVAPALGLPPEAPGSVTAEIGARQAWWAFAAASTAAGLWLLVFRRRLAFHAAGVALLALPHVAGAPQPEFVGGTVPPELAARFVAASLATSLVFWAMLGWFAGRFYERFVLLPRDPS